MLDTEVLVVGAGPVGLALALELGSRGRRCLVVERNERVGLAPRAKTTNVRSRELLRRWGIADRLALASPFGVDHPSNVVFATRLTGGHELARFTNAFHCSPVRDDRFSEHAQWVPQYKVEEVLRARAAELPGVALRFGSRLVDFAEHGDTVEATLAPTHGGPLQRVRTRYLVGADGARSTVRERLGVRMEGRSPLSHNHNIIFRAPGLAQHHGLGPAVMYWLVNGEVPSVVAPLDRDERWTFGCPKLADASVDPATLIRVALGLEVDIEILARDEWTAHQLIATRYRQGRIFLAGDACHLHPPFGGYGMNMGIADAVDLGWKLAARLAGWGGEPLLDSYEAERRPVHRRVVDEAVANHEHVSADLVLDGIEDPGPAGDAVRAQAAAAILRTKRREFDSLGIVLGSGCGDSPVLLPEPGEPPVVSDALRYVPSARAGQRAPHAWLRNGRDRGASLFDHFAPGGFTLLATCPSAADTVEPVAATAAALGVPLRVLAPRHAALRALYGRDLALVRPDQHVAWRGDRAADACAALAVAVGRRESFPQRSTGDMP